jgi:large subunit ribosomal protein L6
MSRVGKKIILIPKDVEITLEQQVVKVKGPKGEMATSVHPNIVVTLADGEDGRGVKFSLINADEKDAMAQWGTARANVASAVKGVTMGFSKQLEVNGVGYRANVSGRKLVLNVGFSHEVPILLPDGIEAKVEGNMITISGIDKHMVGQITDQVRGTRPPEPYKGKGIKHINEIVRRKAGKAAQKAGE